MTPSVTVSAALPSPFRPLIHSVPELEILWTVALPCKMIGDAVVPMTTVSFAPGNTSFDQLAATFQFVPPLRPPRRPLKEEDGIPGAPDPTEPETFYRREIFGLFSRCADSDSI